MMRGIDRIMLCSRRGDTGCRFYYFSFTTGHYYYHGQRMPGY